jgi:hypothetical protein
MTNPTTDLLRRLRATGGKGQCGPLKAEAANEIERMRDALRCILEMKPEQWGKQGIYAAQHLASEGLGRSA